MFSGYRGCSLDKKGIYLKMDTIQFTQSWEEWTTVLNGNHHIVVDRNKIYSYSSVCLCSHIIQVDMDKKLKLKILSNSQFNLDCWNLFHILDMPNIANTVNRRCPIN